MNKYDTVFAINSGVGGAGGYGYDKYYFLNIILDAQRAKEEKPYWFSRIKHKKRRK